MIKTQGKLSVLPVLACILLLSACHTRRLSAARDEGHAEPGFYGNSSTGLVPQKEAELRIRYANILGLRASDLKDIRIYSYIDQWIGTPYLTGGSTHAGIDCSAFSQGLYRDIAHISIPRTSVLQGAFIKEKPVSALQEGDLVFFSSSRRVIDHVGVYLGNGKFVHASTSKGVTISDLSQSWYQRNYIKGGSAQ